MIFTESKKMSKAIDDAVSFASTILFVEPIPSIKDIQALEDALLSLSPIDVQTEIMENDDHVGNLRYYLDVFRYSLRLCDNSGKVTLFPNLSEEALRERLKKEGLQPTSIDFYIRQCQKLSETARMRIEDVFFIFDKIDWKQLKEATNREIRVHGANLLRIFKNDPLVLEEFLDAIKDKKSPEIAEEILEVKDNGLMIEDFSLKALHAELQKLGFPLSRYNGFAQVFRRRQEDGNYKHISNRWLKYNAKVD